jgi:hypothetical protein
MAKKKASVKKAKKKTAAKKKAAVPDNDKPTRLYVGSMGEHYVMAELLARGFNVARAVVDEGIDVIAFKPENPQKLFRVQVKTAFPGAGGSITTEKFTFSLGVKAYEQAAGQDYYLVLVMRDSGDNTFVTAVIPKAIFDDYRDNQDVINWTDNGTNMQIAVHLHQNGSLTMKNVGGTDITNQAKDRWDRIS